MSSRAPVEARGKGTAPPEDKKASFDESAYARTSLRSIKALDISPAHRTSDRGARPAFGARPALMQRKSIIFDESQQVSSPFASQRRNSQWQKSRDKFDSNSSSHIADARISVTRQFALLASGAESRLMLEDKMIRLPLFTNCSAAFVTQLSQLTMSKSFSAGQHITRMGGSGDSLLFLISGCAQVCIDSHLVSELNIGDWWGETHLLGLDNKWTSSLISKDLCNVCEVTRDHFLNVLYEWPKEAQYFEHMTNRNKMCSTDGTLQNPVDILSGLRDDTLRTIDARMVRRLLFPGDYFLEQGAPGDEMYILVRGRADVEIAGRVVRQEWRGSFGANDGHDDHGDEDGELGQSSPPHRQAFGQQKNAPAAQEEYSEAGEPVCFGELGLLGIQKFRSASVVAHSVCQVRVLYRAVFMEALENNGESLQLKRMDQFLQQRYTGKGYEQPLQKLKEVAIFKEVGCSEPFMDFLVQHLEDRMYLAGQKIIDETAADDRCMYILGSGTARVLKGGVEVGTLSNGAVFGEVVLLGLASKRSSTIVANEVCYCQVLHQSVVIRGLELFPEERQTVLMIAFKRDASNEHSTGLDTMHNKTPGSQDWKANNLRSVIKAVKSSSLFGQISSEFIEELSSVSIDRIYMPGDVIIEEGQKDYSLFIMVSGQAAVYTTGGKEVPTGEEDPKLRRRATRETAEGEPKVRKHRKSELNSMRKHMARIGMLTAGSISGELAMLGVSQTRSATIEAETICVMWEITNEKAMPIIEKFPDTRNHFLSSICNHLDHTVSNCLDSLELFKNFERKFRMLLGLYCEKRAFFPGQVIFTEGHQGDGLYVLNLGEGHLERKNISIKRVTAGSHFNSTIMLGFHKWCFCTLTATLTCHVVVVSRISYLQALEQYPSHESHQEMARIEQVANEEFREAVRRLCTRQLIWNKSQVAVADAFNRLTEKVSDSEVLRRVIKAWHYFSKYTARQRRERISRKRSTELWVQKQREAIAFRQQKDQEAALVRDRPLSNERHTSGLAASPLITPRAKVTKYTKLSSLYLHSPQEWESMFPLPKTPRQRQLWGLPAELSEESVNRLPELLGKAKTPRDARAVVMDQQHGVGGTRLPAFAATWEPPAAIWQSTDSLLDWDVAQMLCQ